MCLLNMDVNGGGTCEEERITREDSSLFFNVPYL